MQRLLFFLLFSLTLTLVACGTDDEDDTLAVNTFRFDGTTYVLDQAYVNRYYSDSDISAYDFNLTSHEFQEFGGAFSGIGQSLLLDLTTNDSTGIPDGVYQLADDRPPFSFRESGFAIEYDAALTQGEFSEAGGGTVTFGTTGNLRTVEVDLITRDGRLEGRFAGQFQEY